MSALATLGPMMVIALTGDSLGAPFLAVCIMAAAVGWAGVAFVGLRRLDAAEHELDDVRAKLLRREIDLDRAIPVDDLTGFASRREFDSLVQLEFARFQRYEHPATVLMVEIDGLDELSDMMGPLSSGLVVSELATVLKRTLRPTDLGCRFTDSVLAVLLLETDEREALAVAEKVRHAVAQHSFLHGRQRGDYRLTVSQGAATVDRSMTSHRALIRTGEQALAEARSAGFDSVRVLAAA